VPLFGGERPARGSAPPPMSAVCVKTGRKPSSAGIIGYHPRFCQRSGFRVAAGRHTERVPEIRKGGNMGRAVLPLAWLLAQLLIMGGQARIDSITPAQGP